MIPRHIIQIWLGGDIPDDVGRYIDTVQSHNPDWKHLFITDHALVAYGLNRQELKADFRTWAAASNYVRLLALQRHGGVYLDTDFTCLKPLDPLLAMGDCLAAEQDGGRICNAFMAATPNHPWVNWQLAHFGDYDRRDAGAVIGLTTKAPRDGVTIIEQRLVYPFLYTAAPEDRVPHRDSILCHHWSGSWVRKSQ